MRSRVQTLAVALAAMLASAVPLLFSAPNTASADVTGVQIIRTDDEYFPTIEVQATITNNSEKRSDYFVTIAVESADGATRYEETYLSVDGLEPGQSTTDSTMLVDEVPADAVAVVKEVERLAST